MPGPEEQFRPEDIERARQRLAEEADALLGLGPKVSGALPADHQAATPPVEAESARKIEIQNAPLGTRGVFFQTHVDGRKFIISYKKRSTVMELACGSLRERLRWLRQPGRMRKFLNT
jgi:hypothetical protein